MNENNDFNKRFWYWLHDVKLLTERRLVEIQLMQNSSLETLIKIHIKYEDVMLNLDVRDFLRSEGWKIYSPGFDGK